MIEMILGCRQEKKLLVPTEGRQSKVHLKSSGLATSAFPNR